MRLLKVILLLVLCTSCKAHPVFAVEDVVQPKTLIFAGITDQTNDPEWKNQLISHGLADLIVDELYKTGRFVLVEKSPEVLAWIEDSLSRSWQSDNAMETKKEAVTAALAKNVDVVAYAIVRSFEKSRSGLSLGPFTSSKVRVTVKVEIFLEENGSPSRSAVGKGSGVTKSKGVLFQIRKDKIRFGKTTVGKASVLAVKDAVSKLLL
ncbi:MAG: hypothetical protein ACUZ8H_10695 [Candidatus Anammoxibacter sp.]